MTEQPTTRDDLAAGLDKLAHEVEVGDVTDQDEWTWKLIVLERSAEMLRHSEPTTARDPKEHDAAFERRPLWPAIYECQGCFALVADRASHFRHCSAAQGWVEFLAEQNEAT